MLSLPSSSEITPSICSPLSHHPTLSVLPFQLWATRAPLCPSWWQVCWSCTGRRTPRWSRPYLGRFCSCRPCRASSWRLSTFCWVWPRLSSPPRVSETITFFFPRRLQMCETFKISSLGSLISFQLTPSHIRGISLHFLALSYGGGCFLGALVVQLVYFCSGG